MRKFQFELNRKHVNVQLSKSVKRKIIKKSKTLSIRDKHTHTKKSFNRMGKTYFLKASLLQKSELSQLKMQNTFVLYRDVILMIRRVGGQNI